MYFKNETLKVSCFLNSSSRVFCFPKSKLVLKSKRDGSQKVKSTKSKSYAVQMYPT